VARRIFNVDLLHLAEPFDRWCALRGRAKATVVRELVASAIGEPPVQVKTRADARSEPAAREQAVGVPRKGFTIRLQAVERTALRRQTAAAGMSGSRYVGAMLLAAESGCASVAGKDAVQALTESNHQLAWIGRNLSLALRLQDGAPEHGAQSQGEGLAGAIGLVRQHLARAAAVLAEVERTRIGRRTGSRRTRELRRVKGGEASAR